MAVNTQPQPMAPTAPVKPAFPVTPAGAPHIDISQTGTSDVDKSADAHWQYARDEWMRKHGVEGMSYKDSAALDSRLADYKNNIYQQHYADAIRKNQVDNYNNFDVDRYVKGESDVARRNMARNVMDSQKTVRGNANANGMLFSGHRQMGEAQVGQQANLDFQKYQQDLVKNAMAQKQQLAIDPLKGQAGASAADLQRQLQIQQMQQGQNQQQAQLAGAGLGLIGSGVGSYYGSKTPGKTTPTTDASTYNDGPRS